MIKVGSSSLGHGGHVQILHRGCLGSVCKRCGFVSQACDSWTQGQSSGTHVLLHNPALYTSHNCVNLINLHVFPVARMQSKATVDAMLKKSFPV